MQFKLVGNVASHSLAEENKYGISKEEVEA
jgi:hypothetical protein